MPRHIASVRNSFALCLIVGWVALTDVSHAAAQDCPYYTAPTETGRVQTKNLRELSGLVASRTYPGIFWAHNDSGDDEDIYAIREDGTYVAKFDVKGAGAKDWEDIALGPCPDGRDCLYIGDIGDNEFKRDELRIYRVPEPYLDLRDEDAFPLKGDTERAERFEFKFPGKNEWESEALMVAPDGEVYVFSKDPYEARIFWIPELDPDDVVKAEELNRIKKLEFITAADFAPDGSKFVVRTDDEAWEFQFNGDVAASFDEDNAIIFDLADERQGEAIAYGHGSRTLYTTSEGKKRPMHRYDCSLEPRDDDKADRAGNETLPVTDAESPDGCAITAKKRDARPVPLSLALLALLGLVKARQRR